MRGSAAHHPQASPTRLLEMLSDRFGAFEAIASSSITLARVAPDEERAMEPLVAEAVLEFGFVKVQVPCGAPSGNQRFELGFTRHSRSLPLTSTSRAETPRT
jgi:hypothetical protein